MDLLDEFLESGLEFEAIHSPFVATTCHLGHNLRLHQFLKSHLKTLGLLWRTKLGGYSRDNICKSTHIDCR